VRVLHVIPIQGTLALLALEHGDGTVTGQVVTRDGADQIAAACGRRIMWGRPGTRARLLIPLGDET
jgi:hypothetical protein